MQFIDAEVIDSNHLKVFIPIDLLPGSKVRISIEYSQDIHNEREEWFRLSLKNFENAYGDDEPEYSTKMIKEFI